MSNIERVFGPEEPAAQADEGPGRGLTCGGQAVQVLDPELAGVQPPLAERRRRGHDPGAHPGREVALDPGHRLAAFAAYPIDLPLRCIAAGCKPGGTVLDPFAGSGTTGLAAIQLGRQFTGIDLSPDFARLAAGRLAQAVTARTEDAR